MIVPGKTEHFAIILDFEIFLSGGKINSASTN